MKYHLALGRKIDLDGIDRDAQLGKCPRHVLRALRDRLNATVHAPDGEAISSLDKLRSKISSKPEHWAAARKLSEQVSSGDVIYCTGEDIGIPVAVLCGAKPDRPKIVVYFHNIDRPRGRVALKLFGLANRIDLCITNARLQYNFLCEYVGLPETRVCMLPEQTDIKFFTPGSTSPQKRRQTIVSTGLEKRDYKILAEATKNLDVDVKISSFSKDAVAVAKAFPETMPENMSNRFYEWPDLVQLYRDADVVAVSLVDNQFCAGLTSMLEAMACRRPVVITRTHGLVDYLALPGIVKAVNPKDAKGLQEAIVQLLKNPQEAEAQAQRGYEMAVNHHNSEHYVDVLVEKLRSF
ncbi:glycosyltransferase family 4 protein [Microcoleus sp. B4-D4]|uniref:glycosyltransferase family 4 protein n=1 Tax=Microcoleus sp. B4-D4 TaxID=2818667 RepID=UPI002FD4E301